MRIYLHGQYESSLWSAVSLGVARGGARRRLCVVLKAGAAFGCVCVCLKRESASARSPRPEAEASTSTPR